MTVLGTFPRGEAGREGGGAYGYGCAPRGKGGIKARRETEGYELYCKVQTGENRYSGLFSINISTSAKDSPSCGIRHAAAISCPPRMKRTVFPRCDVM